MAYITNTVNVVENVTGCQLYNVYAFGINAGLSHTAANAYNIAIGANAMACNSGSSNNTAVGMVALRFVCTGGNLNVAIGYGAGYCITTGACNTAVGNCAMFGFPTVATPVTGGFNVAIGHNAMCTVRSGATWNTAVGAFALANLTTGCCNTGIGYFAGSNITSGNNNVYIGNLACLPGVETASGNILISSNNRCIYLFSNSTGVSIFNTSPAAALHVTGDMVATSEITAYYSDRRLKENIKPIPFPLEKLRQINGVTYNPNCKAIGFGFEKDKKHVGVIADEVEKVLPEIVVPAPFDTATNRESITGEYYKTVKYDKMIPLLVESVKELHSKAQDIKKKIEELKAHKNQKK
jgi:hypothetical protein